MKARIIFLLMIFVANINVVANPTMQFRQFSTTEKLPNSMVRQVLQDQQGFIWIATFYGLYRYDGYEIKPFKSDMQRSDFLPSNNVVCLAKDKSQRLWIGTQEGICCLNLKTYEMKKYIVRGVDSKRVNNILVTASGQIYAATIRGLIQYDEKRDSMLLVTGNGYRGDAPGKVNMQSLCEDTNGDLLIATWENGLYRYAPQKKSFSHYPNVMGANKLLVLFRDSRKTIWVGTYGSGAMQLSFSDDKQHLIAKQSQIPLVSDYVYAFCENPSDNSLWIGTRNGITIYNQKNNTSTKISTSEIRNIFKDSDGLMWICTKGAGLLISSPNDNQFSHHESKEQSDLVASIFVESNGAAWVGFGYGVKYSKGEKTIMLIPDKRTYHISQSPSTGHIFIATHDGGLLECKDGKIIKQYLTRNCGFIQHATVRMAYEDVRGNLWVASYRGLGVKYADGREVCLSKVNPALKTLSCEITSIVEDGDGSLWLATSGNGILHLTGNLKDPDNMQCRSYRKENLLMPINTALCLKRDKSGRLWAGTEGCGLCLYDRQKNKFVSVHQQYNLPGDMACSIEEDKYGNLWIGTNLGLARLTFHTNGQGQVRTFTTVDGLGDNFFEQNASCQQADRLFFGCGKGYVSFLVKDVVQKKNTRQVVITEILMNGETVKNVIPNQVKTLLVPSMIKDFTIIFSALDFDAPKQCNYAYRLKGFNSAWRYTTSDNRNVTYTNLSPGTYTFEVKATDVEGNWGPVYSMTVIVEPPFWRTWWAYLIYIIIGVTLLALAVRKIRQKMLLRNKLLFQVNNGEFQLVVDHEEKASDSLESKKLLTFEIKDLNYTDADEMFLKNAFLCVNNHLSDADFDIPQFVEELATSRTTMFKKLKSLTGLSATAFIRDVRLKAACHALDQNPKIRISDLAYQVGFNDPKYFSVCFKKAFGLSPKEYIERQNNSE